MLHIVNGDHAGDTLKAAGLGGDVLPWRDPMHHGPFPAGLGLDATSEVRSRYLTGTDDAFRARDQRLRDAMSGEAIVLWFEHGLLDQLQILQLLHVLADAKSDPGRVTMICIDHHPDIEPFRGLGQLNTAQMATLFPTRLPVCLASYDLARAGWGRRFARRTRTISWPSREANSIHSRSRAPRCFATSRNIPRRTTV